jgi:hypothetical protein
MIGICRARCGTLGLAGPRARAGARACLLRLPTPEATNTPNNARSVCGVHIPSTPTLAPCNLPVAPPHSLDTTPVRARDPHRSRWRAGGSGARRSCCRRRTRVGGASRATLLASWAPRARFAHPTRRNDPQASPPSRRCSSSTRSRSRASTTSRHAHAARLPRCAAARGGGLPRCRIAMAPRISPAPPHRRHHLQQRQPPRRLRPSPRRRQQHQQCPPRGGGSTSSSSSSSSSSTSSSSSSATPRPARRPPPSSSPPRRATSPRPRRRRAPARPRSRRRRAPRCGPRPRAAQQRPRPLRPAGAAARAGALSCSRRRRRRTAPAQLLRLLRPPTLPTPPPLPRRRHSRDARLATCVKELQAGPLQPAGCAAAPAPTAAALPAGLEGLAQRAEGGWRSAAAAATDALQHVSRMQQ